MSVSAITRVRSPREYADKAGRILNSFGEHDVPIMIAPSTAGARFTQNLPDLARVPTSLAYSTRAMTTIEIEHRAAEVLTGGRVHASIAGAHMQWVRDYHGDDAVKELFWRLDADVLRELTTNSDWISFEALIALERSIEQRYGRGRRGFFRELGRYSAYVNLNGVLVRGATVHDFFHRSAFLNARFQDFGRVAYEELDLTRGRMLHLDARCVSPVWCASAIGYYEQALVMQDAIPTRVEEVACRCNGDAHCTFELAWT